MKTTKQPKRPESHKNSGNYHTRVFKSGLNLGYWMTRWQWLANDSTFDFATRKLKLANMLEEHYRANWIKDDGGIRDEILADALDATDWSDVAAFVFIEYTIRTKLAADEKAKHNKIHPNAQWKS